jgi:hypothetical protein
MEGDILKLLLLENVPMFLNDLETKGVLLLAAKPFVSLILPSFWALFSAAIF